METCLSGRKGHPAKVLTAQAVQEFESPRLRQMAGDRDFTRSSVLFIITGFITKGVYSHILCGVQSWNDTSPLGGGPTACGMSLPGRESRS